METATVISIVWGALVTLSALTGVILSQRFFVKGVHHRPITLIFYYTNLSSILAALYFVGHGIYLATKASWLSWSELAGVQLGVACMVSVCLYIFHFLLIKSDIFHFAERIAPLHVRPFEAVLCHYVAPILTIVWWLVMGNHTGLVWYDAIVWCVVPFAWTAFVILYAKLHGPIGK